MADRQPYKTPVAVTYNSSLRRLKLASMGLLAAVFTADLLLPQSVAQGMLYVLPVLLSKWARQRPFTLQVAPYLALAKWDLATLLQLHY